MPVKAHLGLNLKLGYEDSLLECQRCVMVLPVNNNSAVNNISRAVRTFNGYPFLFLILSFVIGLASWSVPTNDPDLGWHLLGGSYVLTHHAVPTVDFINSFNKYWMDYHWLSQVIFELVYETGGLIGLRILVGVVSALTTLVLFATISIRRSPMSNLSALIAVGWAYTLIGSVESIRPQMFSILLVAVSQLVLLKRIRYELLLVCIFAVVCVQMHVYWIFIPILWGAYRCLPRLLGDHTHSPRYVWGGLFLLFLAGLISPYGLLFTPGDSPFPFFSQYLLLYDYVIGSSELREFINEFQGAFTLQGTTPWMMLAAVLLVGWYLRAKPRLVGSISLLTLSLVVFVLAVRTMKFVALFGVVGTPLVFIALRRVFFRIPQRYYPSPASRPLLLGLTIILATSFAVWKSPMFTDNSQAMSMLPLEACRKIPHVISPKPDGTPTRILTHFNYGGWCKWAVESEAPGFNAKVTTDGRTQFVPFENYDRSFNLFLLRFDWAKTLFAWRPDVILVDKERALAQYLIRDENWKLVYLDDSFGLFIPTERQTTPSAE